MIYNALLFTQFEVEENVYLRNWLSQTAVLFLKQKCNIEINSLNWVKNAIYTTILYIVLFAIYQYDIMFYA